MTIERIGALVLDTLDLLLTPGVVALAQVGLEDDLRTPGRRACMLPTVAGHNLLERLLKSSDGLPFTDRLVYRPAQVSQQIGLGGPRHHKGAVMGIAPHISPAFARHIELLAKEGDRLGKGQGAIANGHQRPSSISSMPSSSLAAMACAISAPSSSWLSSGSSANKPSRISSRVVACITSAWTASVIPASRGAASA